MKEHPNIHKSITDLITDDGIDVKKLTPGTILLVETNNSYYEIEIVEGSDIKIQGGILKNGDARFETPQPAQLNGSTWGGSMLKMDWIGYLMNMEVVINNKILLTSNVKNVEITSPDENWSYSLDWNKGDE